MTLKVTIANVDAAGPFDAKVQVINKEMMRRDGTLIVESETVLAPGKSEDVWLHAGVEIVVQEQERAQAAD